MGPARILLCMDLGALAGLCVSVVPGIAAVDGQEVVDMLTKLVC